MFCRSARKQLGDLLEGLLTQERRGAVERHLASCGACRIQRDAWERVAHLVTEADPIGSSPPPMAPADFEQRIMREIRARSGPFPLAARRSGFVLSGLSRSAAIGGALSLMLAAGALSSLWAPPRDLMPRLAGARGAVEAAGSGGGTGPAGLGAKDDMEDGVEPPREVPFIVTEDLVGPRRGRIPLTTYVLEPAPGESAILRTSL